MKINIKNNIWWVGKTDWDLRKFHGDEYSTHHGTTYNSYLIQEEKIVLVDTVWGKYTTEFLSNLSRETDLKKIDYIICNHGETDHSGALPALMDMIPGTPIYCTENGVKSLRGHYHKDWNYVTIKTGDRLSLGNGKELIFIQAPMLHWPDTMFCYLTQDNVLFSNDAFGQHYCSENLFNDLVNQEELYNEAIKYFANILTPFSHLVIRKIEEFVALNLPLDIICTSHGVIWRDDPMQIVKKYLEWSSGYQQDQITLIYDTMWDGTRIIAESIAKGIRLADEKVIVKVFNASNTDKNDIITEIFKSRLVVIGSPTINKGIMHSIAGLLELVRGLKMKNKKAISFGCHGWHNESVDLINEGLKQSGFELISEGIRVNWRPDESCVESLIETGRSLVTR
ncbi:MAG: anaerobic nitric oxide reductase flavorubredoxin [Bacteroidales bacterium]|nr:anaerobic nitric oxide reductase flavorubredoxin [Bacteroidales bacterium]